MTGVLSTAPAGATATGRPSERRLVRWGLPAAIFLLSRVVDTVLLVAGARRQVQLTADNFSFFMARDFPAVPGYLDVITTWDGQYYRYIAESGYGSGGAGDPQFASQQLAWAFPPGFPLTVRSLMSMTGAPFAVVATVLNVVLGVVAMVLLYDLVRRHADRYLAVAVVATTSLFVSAPLLQTAYSESLGLLLLVLALRDIGSGRWLRATVWTLLLSMVRIVTPPLAVVVAVVLLQRRRQGEGVSRRDLLGGGLVVLASVAGAILWAVLASALPRTGGVAPDAAGDRTSALAAFTVRWIAEAGGYWGPGGLAFMTLLVLVVVLLPLTRTGKTLGPELSTWLWAYPLFLFAVTMIQPGMLRYLLLAPGILVPLLGPFRNLRVGRWVALGVLLVLLVLAQRWYVNELLVIDSLGQRFGP